MEKLISEFSVGLFFWQLVIFVALIFLLRKFAWKPILNAVEERETKISDALDLAEKTKREMNELKAQNDELIKKAREERDEILKAARESKEQMIAEAKNQAKVEADKMIESARAAINTEKQAALTEIKDEIAKHSLNIAETILRKNLSSDAAQFELAEKLAKELKLN
ncbi:MAG: F0F1 ATP synthase subunit B [Flavobacteriales bacterium]